MEFFTEWRKYNKEERNSRPFDFLMIQFGVTDVTPDSQRKIQLKISKISSQMSEKWDEGNRTMNRFLSKNKAWLDGNDIVFNINMHHPCPSSCTGSQPQGRPKRNFEGSSFKTKSY